MKLADATYLSKWGACVCRCALNSSGRKSIAPDFRKLSLHSEMRETAGLRTPTPGSMG